MRWFQRTPIRLVLAAVPTVGFIVAMEGVAAPFLGDVVLKLVEAAGVLALYIGYVRLIAGGGFGPEASIIAVAICLAAGCAILALAYRRGRFVAPFWRRPATAASDAV